MAASETVAWGWIDHDGTPQTTTFETAEQAIAEMRDRLGKPGHSVEDIARIGYRLARVRVVVETISALRSE